MDGDQPLLNHGPLVQHGARLIDNGYNITPIMVGAKRPKHSNWTKIEATKKQLRDWIEHGHRMSGTGIITKNNPGVDIDVADKAVVDRLLDIAQEIFGEAPLRIGRKPRVLLLFRTEAPFKKMASNKYEDLLGDTHQVEILCDGQQFVAYHTHPDTGLPYKWPNEAYRNDANGDMLEILEEGGPLTIRSEDLTAITVEQCREFIERFEEIAATMEDWELVTHASKARRAGDQVEAVDAIWTTDGRKVDMTMQELRNRLMLIPADLGYDDWRNVGMALYHHSDGDPLGLEIWHEWSSEYDTYDAAELDDKWSTFSISDKPDVVPITATFILARSKNAVEQKSAKLELELRDMFLNARELSDWKIAQTATREAEVDMLARSSLVELAKKKLDQLKGTNTPISEVRKALAFAPKGSFDMPAWIEPWVYDTSNDRFFHTEHKISVTKQGFDAMFDRQAVTKKDLLEGKESASRSASDLALQVFPVEVVQGRRYEPGQDSIFYDHGRFANTYAEHEIPPLPEKETPRDRRAIERVKNHIRHLLVNVEERHLFLDWLSWVVQNPGKHVNWAILLQGTEGDGKSFFAQLMRAVMGASNVRMLNAQSLEGNFTDWTVGQCLTCIEEVRLINPNNKYEVLNKIKPYITNEIIEVHPKGSPQYNARNTTSYLMFSNFRDALPLGENGRRYCVLFSRYQTKAMLQKFVNENPDYYEELYLAIAQCAPAIRKWLLNREQQEKFKPFGDAPDTEARKFMIREAQPEMIQALDEVISQGENALITENLLDLDSFKTEMLHRDVEVFKGKGMNAALARHDFELLGRVKINGVMRTVYSKIPENWRYIGASGQVHVDFDRIRKHIEKHQVDPTSTDLDDEEL